MNGLQIIPTATYSVLEDFGVKGLAELILRAMVADGTTSLDFTYSTANAAKLRKAASKITEATDGASTFTFLKCGNDYREVTYTVSRQTKSGKVSHEITRKFLNCEAIRVTAVQAEADAAIEADES